jgi:hypothetical protein
LAVKWDDVHAVARLENEPRQMYELSKKRQRLLGDSEGKKVQIYEYAKDRLATARRFDLRYILAILASSFGKRFLLLNSRDENIMSVRGDGESAKSRIYPDDLKEFPIKDISLREQEPFIEKVDFLLAENWKIHDHTRQGHKIKFNYLEDDIAIEIDFPNLFDGLRLPCWNFLDAEPHRFEVIGDRSEAIGRIKQKNTSIYHRINNREKPLLRSDSEAVLNFLARYLPRYEKQGLTWSDLLERGRIPKKDEDIDRIFQERERLEQEIRDSIAALRQAYRELDTMVARLYGAEPETPPS